MAYRVQVLLATYNGSLYLKEMLDSLLTQTYQDFSILIHDDGSTDSTIEILESYIPKFGKNRFLIRTAPCRFGFAKDSFFYLLGLSSSELVFFADQDDVWLSDKIKDTVTAYDQVTCQGPVVVYTDLTVVDSNLEVISASMMDYQHVTKNVTFQFELTRNAVTGCTMALNRELCNRLVLSEHAVMHDWWITLSVLNFGGSLIYIDKPTILYRQHGANDTGAHSVDLISMALRIFSLKKEMRNIAAIYKQSKQFSDLSFPYFLYLKFKNILL